MRKQLMGRLCSFAMTLLVLANLSLGAIAADPPLAQPAPAPTSSPSPEARAVPAPAASDTLKSQRAADLKKQVEKKKEAAQKKRVQRNQRAALEHQMQMEQRAYVERMMPIWQAQQRANAAFSIEAAKTRALQEMAAAQQANAATDRARLRLEQWEAGIPFVPVPGGGMQPYPYTPGAGP
jgi:hypothetical protein